MDHTTFTEKMSLWLDNELNSAEVAELQSHLHECSACRHTYHAMQRVDILLQKASTFMVEPRQDFSHRFEVHLAQYQASRGNIWLGLGTLLLGTLFFIVAGGVASGVAIFSTSTTLLNVGFIYQGLVTLIDSMTYLQVILNLGSVVVKAGLITMSQPLFWGSVLGVIGLTWLWVLIMKRIYRKTSTTIQLFV